MVSPVYVFVLNTNDIIIKAENIVGEAVTHLKNTISGCAIIIEDPVYEQKYTKIDKNIQYVNYYQGNILKKSVSMMTFHITLTANIKAFKSIVHEGLVQSVTRYFAKKRRECEDNCGYPLTRLVLNSSDPIRITSGGNPIQDRSNEIDIAEVNSDTHENEQVSDLSNGNRNSMLNILWAFWFHMHWYVSSMFSFNGAWLKNPKKDIRIVVTLPNHSSDKSFHGWLLSSLYWNYQKSTRGRTMDTKYAPFKSMTTINKNQCVKTSLKELKYFNRKERVLGWWFAFIYSLLRTYFYMQILNMMLTYNWKIWFFISLRYYYIEWAFYLFDFFVAYQIVDKRLYVSKRSVRSGKRNIFGRFFDLWSHVFTIWVLLIGSALVSVFPAWSF